MNQLNFLLIRPEIIEAREIVEVISTNNFMLFERMQHFSADNLID